MTVFNFICLFVNVIFFNFICVLSLVILSTFFFVILLLLGLVVENTIDLYICRHLYVYSFRRVDTIVKNKLIE